MDINIKLQVTFEDRFIQVLEGLGKVYAVIQPDKIDEGRQRAISAAEAVQENIAEDTATEVTDKDAPVAEEKEAVPTSKPAYTFEQLQLAAANLARGGKRKDLANLLKEFEVSSLPDLEEDKFDAFAVRLRSLGGTI